MKNHLSTILMLRMKHLVSFSVFMSLFYSIFAPANAVAQAATQAIEQTTTQTTQQAANIVPTSLLTLNIAGFPLMAWLAMIFGVIIGLSAVYLVLLSYYEHYINQQKAHEPVRHLYRPGKDFGGNSY